MSIHVLKAVAIVTSVHLNYDLSIIYVASHFLSIKVSPEKRLKVKVLVNSLISFLWLFFSGLSQLAYTYPVTKYNLAHVNTFTSLHFRHTYMLLKVIVYKAHYYLPQSLSPMLFLCCAQITHQ